MNTPAKTLKRFYDAIKPLPSPAWDDGRGRVLIVGDATQLLQLLPPAWADVFLTDPPYSSGGAFRGDRNQSTSTKYRLSCTLKADPDFEGDTRDQRSFERWTTYWSSAAYRATRPGGAILCFTDWRQIAATVDAHQVAGWTYRGVAGWDKSQATRPQLGWFRQQLEFMVCYSRGAMSRGKAADGIASPGVFREYMPGRNKIHLTQKPEAMLVNVLKTRHDWSIVADPFAGSGSTLKAAAQLGKCAVAFELSDEVAAIAIRENLDRPPTDPATTANAA
jgi:site-specific DNA-methyltransferase (adenine-specific)